MPCCFTDSCSETLREFNPNWHETGHFYLPCNFGIGFYQMNFYEKFPNCLGDENWHQLGFKGLTCILYQLRKFVIGGVACSLLKLGSLEKTVIASRFHSGLHSSSSFFCRKNHTIWPFAFIGDSPFFYMKKTKKILWCQIDFLIIWNFFCSNHFLIRCQTKVLL